MKYTFHIRRLKRISVISYKPTGEQYYADTSFTSRQRHTPTKTDTVDNIEQTIAVRPCSPTQVEHTLLISPT